MRVHLMHSHLNKFQSTLSVWRATISDFSISDTFCHFNPRSPCGERLQYLFYQGREVLFQSTLSVWRATVLTAYEQEITYISIHALRVESDRRKCKFRREELDFNPRSPCGERPMDSTIDNTPVLFQSTLSVWRATFLQS